MDIGVYANTHGLGYRINENFLARSLPPEQTRTVQIAQLAERLGFHSMWFPDHACMPLQSTSAHVANASGTRAYQPRHTMLDAAVMMGAVAVSTTRLKLGTSVLIAPYRNPLSDARQFATIDLLSSGRLLFGVGAGWMAEEFEALGVPYSERAGRTEECIEIYKRSWMNEIVEFQGRFYGFRDLAMEPKPAQQPRPPILYGGVTPVGARRAARLCDGYYPIFLDTYADPSRYAAQQDLIRRELEKLKRDPAQFAMLGTASARLTSASAPETRAMPRPICTGSAEQVLTDFTRFAEAGYSLVVCFFDCPNGQMAELEEQMQRFGEVIIPRAKGIAPKGGWRAKI